MSENVHFLFDKKKMTFSKRLEAEARIVV